MNEPYCLSLQREPQAKRTKQKMEELRKDLGSCELVELAWDIYYKKVATFTLQPEGTGVGGVTGDLLVVLS